MSEPATLAARPSATLRKTLPRRLRAAGIHLGITALVFGLVCYLVRVRWFPGFHFSVDGGWQGLRLAFVAQLVLGPLLTLVIFNPFKARRLIAFDLVCIGLAQTAALVLGFHAVYGQRPVSINFYDGVFYSMPASSVRAGTQVDVADAGPGRWPTLVYVALPANDQEARRVAERTDRTLMAHEDVFFFHAFAPNWPAVQAYALDPAGTRDVAFARDLPAFLAQHAARAADLRFFRYQGGYGSCIVALSAAGEVVGALGCARA